MHETKINSGNLKGNIVSNSYVDIPIKQSYSEAKKPITIESFDSGYSEALKLMGGDRLLKPSNSGITVRKTSTHGVYKIIIEHSSKNEIKILDESQLFANKRYASGSISKLSDDEYEIMSFDDAESMEINHFNKTEAIEFMNANNLSF